MKILHLDSSVTGEKSVSRPLTQYAAEKLKSLHPDAEYTYRDLVKNTLRHYTAVLRLYGDNVEQITDQQKSELETGKEILEEFLAADIVLIGAPMYNFNIPSQLKAWIDLNCIAGKTFSYGENEKAIDRHSRRLMTRIWEAAGARDIFALPRAAHTIGTCRMGHDAGTNVVDADGRSFDIDNLYVCDNSVFPSALPANPALTIMALGLRTAERFLAA